MSGHRWPVIALLTPVALMLMGASSCGLQQTTVNQPGHSSSSTSGQSSPGGQIPASTQAPVAHVGSTLTLTGNNSGEQVDITLVQVVDPAKGKDDFNQPDAGNRFVAVEVRYKNTGTVTEADSVGNEAKLVDGAGHSYDTSFADTTAGPSFAGDQVNIAPGETGDGFITFQLPNADKPAELKITLNSGFASDTGAWQIP